VPSRAAHIARRARRAFSRREYPVVPAHIGKLDYVGADVLVGVTSRTEILSRLRPVGKEPWTVQWLESSLRSGDVLWDVGANIGAYSLIAAKLGRSADVVAVEPGYASYAALCDNIVLNGLDDEIVPLPVLLGEETGLATLAYRDVTAGAAEHSLAGLGAHRQPTLTFRLDDLVEHHGLPAPTLMKIDVDGAEDRVLAGAPATLARPELRSVLVEIERKAGDAVVAVLAAAGLQIAERVDERDGEHLAHVWYGIFERRAS
jgi:FkbM family methyltransferase